MWDGVGWPGSALTAKGTQCQGENHNFILHARKGENKGELGLEWKVTGSGCDWDNTAGPTGGEKAAVGNRHERF